jgi:hypothetical protein
MFSLGTLLLVSRPADNTFIGSETQNLVELLKLAAEFTPNMLANLDFRTMKPNYGLIFIYLNK